MQALVNTGFCFEVSPRCEGFYFSVIIFMCLGAGLVMLLVMFAAISVLHTRDLPPLVIQLCWSAWCCQWGNI